MAQVKLDSPASGRKNRGLTLGLTLLLVASALAAHWQSIHYPFVAYDDAVFVYENPLVMRGLTLDGLRYAFLNVGHDVNWVPIDRLSHMLDVQLYGLNPWGHHLTNILLHTADTALLFLLLVLMTGARWRSALAAALFAVHPVHVESIAWISERRDVLSMFFGLLTLMAYVVYVQKRMVGGQVKGWRGWLGWYLLVCLGTLLAVMSKPVMVTLPCMMWLLDVWPLGRLGRAWSSARRKTEVVHLIVDKLPLLMLVSISIVLTIIAQQYTITSKALLPWSQRLVGVPLGYLAYLKLLVWPVHISPLYPISFFWTIPAVLLGIVVMLVITYVVVRTRRQAPWLIVGWLWFVGTMVPMIGLMHVGVQAFASRYAYLPFIGLYIMIAWSVGALLDRVLTRRWRWTASSLVVAVLVLAMVGSWQQTRIWSSSVALYHGYVDPMSPANPMTASYVETLIRKDKYEEAKRILHRRAAYSLANARPSLNSLANIALFQNDLDRAHALCILLLRANMGDANTWICLGRIAMARNQLQLAQSNLERGVAKYPQIYTTHLMLAHLYDRLDMTAQAQEQFELALNLCPHGNFIFGQVGQFMFKHGKYERAITLLTEALKHPCIVPRKNLWYTLGVSLSRTGLPREAENAYRHALKLEPDWSAANNSLGIVLAQMNRMEEATQAFALAVKADLTDQQAVANLARARAATQPATQPTTQSTILPTTQSTTQPAVSATSP